jgi:hypothetical protein
MVNPEHTATADGSSRLVTFETSDIEQLLIRAGENKVRNRVLYQGNITSRKAVAPKDELVGEDEPGDNLLGFDAEALIKDMQIVGDSAPGGADENKPVALYRSVSRCRSSTRSARIRTTLDVLRIAATNVCSVHSSQGGKFSSATVSTIPRCREGEGNAGQAGFHPTGGRFAPLGRFSFDVILLVQSCHEFLHCLLN